MCTLTAIVDTLNLPSVFTARCRAFPDADWVEETWTAAAHKVGRRSQRGMKALAKVMKENMDLLVESHRTPADRVTSNTVMVSQLQKIKSRLKDLACGFCDKYKGDLWWA